MKWLKKNGSAIFLVFLLLTGAGLMAYPSVSAYFSARQQLAVITGYVENVVKDNGIQYEQLLAEADAYNEEIGENGIRWLLSQEEQEEYKEYLKTDSSGIMAYIEIPAINCKLPIYHGTSEAVLQVGVGHCEGTSLPVGGKSSHCVLSGHCGLPDTKLFTDLDQVKEKDTFTIYTLGRVLTYEVDQICVVEPTDFSKLQIEEGKDYCTLITCTPYGVNSHRLLVRGKRLILPEEGFEE